MNLKEIKEMINLMNEHSLQELEVEREGKKVKIIKSSPTVSVKSALQPSEYTVESTPSPSKADEEKKAPAQSVSSNVKEITSPMVGTFYRAPAPEAPPFVEIGQVIEEGQVVCIIEAMKLMNEIKSEIRGKVKEIVVENAEPVEFGQSLIAVEPV